MSAALRFDHCLLRRHKVEFLLTAKILECTLAFRVPTALISAGRPHTSQHGFPREIAVLRGMHECTTTLTCWTNLTVPPK